jgi:molybdate transport system ATP-binding protein
MPFAPQNKKSFLSMKNASFRLGARLVFENTNWDFCDGEHWAILGNNGSGKSLLADAIRGALPLVQGELEYGFRPFEGSTPEECIGHVSFQARKSIARETVVQSRWNTFEQASGLRVSEYLSYESVMDINPFEETDRHEGGKSNFEKRRKQFIRYLGVDEYLGRTVLSLSNGERQRVEIARALCLPLRLLILDEPAVGLDVASRRHLSELLEKLMQTRLRVIIVTSRPADLPAGVSHGVWVEDCKIVASGPRRGKVMARYFHGRGKSGRGQPHSKTWRTDCGPITRGSVAECGCPLPLSKRPHHRLANRELVRLRNVAVRYGTATLLSNINWEVKEGESWALLGPNGSGKTTLLSLIIGDNPQAYSNEVVVFGKQRGTGESIWELKRQIGWVSPELHAHFDDKLSCLAAIESGLRDTVGLYALVSSTGRKRSLAWLQRFGLGEFAGQPLFSLSTGLQRMALLARALVKEPKLLILDEPCQGLDDQHRELFITTVDQILRTSQVTAIYVTHPAEEIPSSIQKVFRLKKGVGIES